MATHCSGGVILGFEQFQCNGGVYKRGAKGVRKEEGEVVFPTPWNHLVAGILYSLGFPLLVFKEAGISGGVFDPGVTDVFVHTMPKSDITDENKSELREVFLKWQARVRELYYYENRPTRHLR